MRFLQTSRRFFNQGVELLYPSIGSDLACASRYVRAKVYKELCPAPFASTVLGVKVHERVAESLRSGLPVDREAFQLPRRLMINSGENLENLIGRAERSLNRYDSHYRPYLLGKALRVEERLSWELRLGGEPVRFLGKIDLILEEERDLEIWDWKTGGLQGSREQLRLYLFLVYGATGRPPRLARAVGLESGGEVVEPWSEDIVAWGYGWLRSTLETLRAALAEPDGVNPGPACRYCPYAHACAASMAPGRYLLDSHTGEVKPLSSGI